MVSTVEDQRLDQTFAALANSTRRSILARLAEGEASVTELARPFDLTLPAVSKHLKVLEQAGLIVKRRRAQSRPCTLEPTAFAAVATWADQYRPIWETRLDRMEDHLRTLDRDGATPDPPRQEDHV
jgi:DNA-binding transcriptional ArsR family regulator